MNSRDRKIIIALFVLLVLLIGRLIFLLKARDESFIENQYIKLDAVAGMPERDAITKTVMHIQRSFPLPIFIKIQNDGVEEESVLKSYNSWNSNNADFKHYCIFILLSFTSRKLYFISGERLRIYLDDKKVRDFIEGPFQGDIDNGRFAKAINDLVNLLYDELQDDKNSIIEDLNREKNRVNVENLKQKWYFIISGLILVFLIYCYLCFIRRKRCRKCGSSVEISSSAEGPGRIELKKCIKCGYTEEIVLEKSRNVKKIERLGSLKKDWK